MTTAEQIVALNDDLIKVRNQNFQLVKLVDKLTDALRESSATVVNGEKLQNLTERLRTRLKWATGRPPGLVSIEAGVNVYESGKTHIVHRVYVGDSYGGDFYLFPDTRHIERFVEWLESAWQPADVNEVKS